MSYKLERPYTNIQKCDFIVKYNHEQGLKIIETTSALYALEKNEVLENDKVVINVNFEKEEALRQKEKIKKLKLTKREVFLALYEYKNITPDDIKSLITDKKALIEFEFANDYYRGNPLIDEIASKLAISEEEIDYLFVNGKFENA